MATPHSIRLSEREFGSENRKRNFGSNLKGASTTSMENDVFLPAENVTPVGKPGFSSGLGLRKASALADASNSLKKVLSDGKGKIMNHHNSSGFKKPTVVSKKVTKSTSEVIGLNVSNVKKISSKMRSQSTTSATPNPKKIEGLDKIRLQELDEMYEMDYPEAEMLRDISRQHVGGTFFSPIEISDDVDSFGPVDFVHDDINLFGESDMSEDAVDSDGDNNWPETETLPPKYASTEPDMSFLYGMQEKIDYKPDYPAISEPPLLKYDQGYMDDFFSELFSETEAPSFSEDDDIPAEEETSKTDSPEFVGR